MMLDFQLMFTNNGAALTYLLLGVLAGVFFLAGE